MTYMSPSARQAEPTERDPLVAFARHWWWLLLIGAIIGVAAAVVYSRVAEIPYQSTALVQVATPSGPAATANAEQARSATANFTAEVSSPRIYVLVSEALRGTYDISASQLESMERDGAIQVSAARTANFIRIVVSDADPQFAKLLADTIAVVFVDDITARAEAGYQARQAQLEEQIQFTRDELARSALQQREIDLEEQLRSQESEFLNLQASYQAELQRQNESAALSDRSAFSDSELGQQTAVRIRLLEIINQQITDIETNVAAVTEDLAAVRAELAALPPDLDGSLSAAFATAYSLQLSALTERYVSDQIDAFTASAPVVRYGEASTPFADQGLKKLGLFGIMGGMAAAAGIGFAIEQARKWRAARAQSPAALGDSPGWDPNDPDLVRLIAMVDDLAARKEPENGHVTGAVIRRVDGSTTTGE